MRIFKRASKTSDRVPTEAEQALMSAVDQSVEAQLALADQREKLALAQADATDLSFAEALLSQAEFRSDVTATGVRLAVTGLVLETLTMRLAERAAAQLSQRGAL